MTKLNESIHDNFQSGKKLVLDAISDKEYRYKRHGILYSLAAVYTECTESLCKLTDYLRETDDIIKISPMCFCICFDVTDTSGALKVSQNIISNFAKIDNTKKYI